MKTIHTPEYKRLLEWLRKNRKDAGMTMRVVALALKIPHSWVGKVEIGERRLDILEFVKLCRVIGADPHAGLSLLVSAAKKAKPAAKKARRR